MGLIGYYEPLVQLPVQRKNTVIYDKMGTKVAETVAILPMPSVPSVTKAYDLAQEIVELINGSNVKLDTRVSPALSYDEEKPDYPLPFHICTDSGMGITSGVYIKDSNGHNVMRVNRFLGNQERIVILNIADAIVNRININGE